MTQHCFKGIRSFFYSYRISLLCTYCLVGIVLYQLIEVQNIVIYLSPKYRQQGSFPADLLLVSTDQHLYYLSILLFYCLFMFSYFISHLFFHVSTLKENYSGDISPAHQSADYLSKIQEILLKVEYQVDSVCLHPYFSTEVTSLGGREYYLWPISC